MTRVIAGRWIGLLSTALAAACWLGGTASPSFAQGCTSVDDSLHACVGLDDNGYCTAVCSLTPSQFIATSVSDTNFYPKLREANALALIQAATGDAAKKKALDNARQVLGKAGFSTVDVNNVTEAIQAINSAYAANGNQPVHVVIVGHGRPGSIKVGEARMNHDTQAGVDSQAVFVAGVQGKLANLILVGCRVAEGAPGEAFLLKLNGELGVEVHAWKGDIYPDPNLKTFWVEGDKKIVRPVPGPQGWALAALTLMLLTTAVVAIRRRGWSEA